ncbi:lytic transglycosylase domain-containing protein [Microaerobacter geothermalis]|uniref:lytic transglycosylase domain-containing protein n=1 Tax=Microaerobacter geothermalis TaxID=674972 RepID=UPI001F454267|nr:lytic transglycosylase domain-containing protein [Microaerobacter geothermalis]MCF6092972.1 lytic transglycosylase domain-containing protein [Microaerobacter geothermalis]
MIKLSKREIVLFILLAIVFIALNTPWVWQNMYPIFYVEEVMEASKLFDVDPYLILAIIQIESNYVETTQSKKGAIGLMQLMPETAKWAIKEGNFPKEVVDKVNEPEVNIFIGTWYVSFLKRKFNGNYAAVVAAYNAGPGNVEKWLSQGIWDGTIEKSEWIPYGETRHYLQRVFYYYGRYQRIYDQK